MLDCGAGVGGPSAFARAETGIVPTLCDPEYGACRAAQRLFGLPIVQARALSAVRGRGVRRGLEPGGAVHRPRPGRLLGRAGPGAAAGGRLGLLVFVAPERLREQPEGNHFLTPDGLRALLPHHGLTVTDSASVDDFAAEPTEWQQRTAQVEDELRRRHGSDPRWQAAADQADIMGRLLADGRVTGELLVARQRRRERRSRFTTEEHGERKRSR